MEEVHSYYLVPCLASFPSKLPSYFFAHYPTKVTMTNNEQFDLNNFISLDQS